MSLASGDLTTLATVQQYVGALSGAGSVAVASGLITRTSRSILTSINRSFILPKSYLEYYDGSGTGIVVLPNWPVLSLASLYVGGSLIPAAALSSSQFFTNGGWTLQPWDGVPPGAPAEVILRGGYDFCFGRRNVAISYVAGYQVTNEAAVIPASPPYQVTPAQPYGIWASDRGVTYADGTPLEAISSGVPVLGQYLPPAPDLAVNPRLTYTFAAANAGRSVLLSYGFVPADLEQVALEMIGERTAYRTRPGVRSQSLANQEMIAYGGAGLSDFAASVLELYRSVLPPPISSAV